MSKKDKSKERHRKVAERKNNQRKQLQASKSPELTLDPIVLTQPPRASTQGALRSFSGHTKSFLIWAATIGSILGGYVILRPDVTIEPDFFLNDREPFSAYFRVQNRSVLSIYDVRFSCEMTGGIMANVGTGETSGQTKVAVLKPGDSATKNCGVSGEVFSGPATLTFMASYRPSLWPWRNSREEHFTAIQDAKHFFHWTHQAL